MLALFGPLAFNIRTPRCEVSKSPEVPGPSTYEIGGENTRAPCPRYICSTLVSFRMESRTPMGHNLIPRRASEGPPKGLKTDEQKFRSLRAPDILV
jgi:hypothetical protein